MLKTNYGSAEALVEKKSDESFWKKMAMLMGLVLVALTCAAVYSGASPMGINNFLGKTNSQATTCDIRESAQAFIVATSKTDLSGKMSQSIVFDGSLTTKKDFMDKLTTMGQSRLKVAAVDTVARIAYIAGAGSVSFSAALHFDSDCMVDAVSTKLYDSGDFNAVDETKYDDSTECDEWTNVQQWVASKYLAVDSNSCLSQCETDFESYTSVECDDDLYELCRMEAHTYSDGDDWGSCTCSYVGGEECDLPTPKPTPKPTPNPTAASSSSNCFSFDTMVDVENRGLLPAKDIQLGDRVLSYDFDSKTSFYDTVLGRAHFDIDDKSDELSVFRQICSAEDCITLSYHHLIYTTDALKRADEVVIGDYIFTEHKTVQVTSLEDVETMARTFFTWSGKVIANGIVASCYTGTTATSHTIQLFLSRSVWLVVNTFAPHLVNDAAFMRQVKDVSYYGFIKPVTVFATSPSVWFTAAIIAIAGIYTVKRRV